MFTLYELVVVVVVVCLIGVSLTYLESIYYLIYTNIYFILLYSRFCLIGTLFAGPE